MSKFCTSCGRALADDAMFCTGCGAKIPQASQVTAAVIPESAPQSPYAPPASTPVGVSPVSVSPDGFTVPAAPQNAPPVKKIALLAGAAAAVAIVIFLLVSLLYKPYKEPLDNLCEGVTDGNLSKILKVLPEDALNGLIGDTDDLSDLIDKQLGSDDAMKSLTDGLEKTYGDNFKLDYKILGADHLNKNQRENIQDTYEALLDDDFEVKSAYALDVRFTASGDDMKNYATYNITVGKVNGDWAVVDINHLLSDYSSYVPGYKAQLRELADEVSGDSSESDLSDLF
ncbi:MAG: zinc ribbon domain-containing protein [Oscillospiraceae bacterium]